MVRRSRDSRPGVLILVQNLPVPFDRRVWLECQTLTSKPGMVFPAGGTSGSLIFFSGYSSNHFFVATNGVCGR